MLPNPDPAQRSATGPAGEHFFLLRWIVRLRWPIFAFLGILLISGYSGQWRVGRDSALYREVARNLAQGRGYTFRGVRERQIYPGVPCLLASVEKLAGPQDAMRPRTALALMVLMAAATLVTVYHLVRTCYPQWCAVCVTTGVGINQVFLQQAHELTSDLPFLLGICLLLLGIARVVRTQQWRSRILYGLLAAGGTVLAAAMRPTIWAMVVAAVATCLVGVIRSRRRLWYAIAMAAIAAALLAWWALDPRLHGSVLSGKYESSALAHLRQLSRIHWIEQIERTFGSHLPESFFGFELVWHTGLLAAPLALGSALLLWRKSALWTLYVLTTLGMTLILGSVPRYYLMILPLLLIEWAVLVHWAATRFRAHLGRVSELVLLLGLGAATVPNLVMCISFVLEQHGIDKRLHHTGFLVAYRGAQMKPLVEMGQTIAQRVPSSARLLGPEARILTFLSGRNVYHPSEILPRKRGVWRDFFSQPRFDYCIYGLPGDQHVQALIGGSHPYIRVRPRESILSGGMTLVPTRVPRPPRPPRKRPASAIIRKRPTTAPARRRPVAAPTLIPLPQRGPAPRGQ